MTSDRKNAIIVGALFILATAMGILNAITLGPLVGSPDYLVAMSKNSTTVMASTLFNIVMSGAVIAIAVVIFPILKRSGETLAVGYLAARIIEGILLLVAGMTWLSLMSLGNEFIEAGQPAGSHYQTLGDFLVFTSTSIFTIAAEITFGISALILNTVLIKAKLVPRLLSIWGFVAGALILILGAMKVLGISVSAVEMRLRLQ